VDLYAILRPRVFNRRRNVFNHTVQVGTYYTYYPYYSCFVLPVFGKDRHHYSSIGRCHLEIMISTEPTATMMSSLPLKMNVHTAPITADDDLQHQGVAKKQRVVARRNLVIKPSDYVKSAFRVNGTCLDTRRSQLEPRFKPPTQAMIRAFTPELMNLVRQNDYEGLQILEKEGRLINCCNKFGESLLHLACRRGHNSIVRLLVEEANVSLYMRDDYKRTPLHDACWTAEPNFELLDWLIREAPDLLIVEDIRGFTPFDYVRKDDWGKWLRFLWERRASLHPKYDHNDQPVLLDQP
jgi:hypothetical protein